MTVSSLSAAGRRNLTVGSVTAVLLIAILILTGLTPERWVDIDEAKADSWNWRLSVATADTALVLLVATLALGPWRVFRGGRPAVHRPVRRVLGLWAGGVALVHVAFAVFIHADGWGVLDNWFLRAPSLSDPLPLLRGKRGLANWVGLAQVGLVVLLLAISRDAALRRLGRGWWKRLQRSAYLLIAFVALHVLLFQSIERRLDRHRIPVLLLLGLIVLIQAGGAVVVHRRASSATS